MLGVIERKITEKLESSQLLCGMNIEPFPAEFEDYNFTSALGCILIQYAGEDFDEPETLSLTAQTDTYSYIVYVGLRSLSSLNEAYPVLKEVKDLLTGLRIDGVNKDDEFSAPASGKELYPVSIKYAGKINYNDNFWSMTFKINLPNASKYEHIPLNPSKPVTKILQRR